MKIHFPDRPHVCSKCLTGFKRRNTLNDHTQIEHGFKCAHCELSFVKRKSFKLHVNKCPDFGNKTPEWQNRSESEAMISSICDKEYPVDPLAVRVTIKEEPR